MQPVAPVMGWVPERKHAAPLLRQTCPLARSAAAAALAAAGMRANGGRLQIGMSPGRTPGAKG